MDKQLNDAIVSQTSVAPLRYISKLATNDTYPLGVKGEKNANDVTVLLDNLGNLFRDHTELSSAVQGLCIVVAQQQNKISQLEDRIQELLHAKIAVEAQNNANKIIAQLALEGCDIDQTEITVHVSGTVDSEEYEDTASMNQEASHSSEKIETSLSGSFKKLLSLKLSRTSAAEMESLFHNTMKRTSAKKLSTTHQGNLTIRFNAITGSPLAKAKAKSLLQAE